MNWINEYSKGMFQVFSGNVIEGFQPIDFFHFLPMWYDLWIDKVAELIRNNGLEGKTYNELRAVLPPPSNMRAILEKVVPSYKGFPVKRKDNIRLVTDFFARMLYEACPADPFALTSNRIHSAEQVQKIFSKLGLREATTQEARRIGQLITSIGSLAHGLYNDLTIDLGWEAFGPYRYQDSSGAEYSVLMRWFPNMQPFDLWPQEHLASYKELFIYSLYQGVDWQISFIGCHTMAISGSPVQGMRKFAVVADGKLLSDKQITSLIEESSAKAVKLYQTIRQMSFEELKKKVQLQETYQLKKLFDTYNQNWQPTLEMISRIEGKSLLQGILPHGVMIEDFEDFKEVFGINKFSSEIL